MFEFNIFISGSGNNFFFSMQQKQQQKKLEVKLVDFNTDLRFLFIYLWLGLKAMMKSKAMRKMKKIPQHM